MTDILPPAGWPNVRQLETNEFATGGSNGNMNEQAKSLVARSELLKKYAALPYESKTGGYALNERVQLATGDIVRSTIPSNVNNPNENMTGWVKTNDASQIFDASGLSQQEVNNDINKKARRDNETVYDYGAVGGGNLHTVQEWYTIGATHYRGYANLAAVQGDYPFVTDAGFSSDQAAILKLVDVVSVRGGGTVDLSTGVFIVKPINDLQCLSIPAKVTLVGNYEETVLHEITDVSDSPATSVWWDTILFEGVGNDGGGVKNITFRHTGGRRNNTCTIAVRNGATRKKITGNIFENSIGSCVGIEGSVANPVITKCLIQGNSIKASSRHGVYLSGSRGNHVTQNDIFVSALEAVQNRNPSDNTVDFNNFYGVSGVEKSAIMFTQPPVGETVPYKVKNYVIENNKFYDLRAAAVSSGVGVINEYAKVKGNVVYMSDDTTTTEHALSLFRFKDSEISENYIDGGRNRAVALYGCVGNSIFNNNIKNVMSNTATGAPIQLQTHTDSIDGSVTSSTGNKISGGSIVDDRTTIKHVNAVNFLTGSNGNTVSDLTILGTTSSTLISSADGLGANYVGIVFSNPIFGKTALPVGTQAAIAMSLSAAQQFAVSRNGFVQSLRMDVTQLLTAGTVRCRIYKNGATFSNILFTANNSVKFIESFFQPNQLSVARGDVLTATIESTDVTSGQTSFDTNFSVRLAE